MLADIYYDIQVGESGQLKCCLMICTMVICSDSGENLFKDIKKAEEREGPSKGEQLTVQKRNGRLEPFSDKKMARSLAGLEPHS